MGVLHRFPLAASVLSTHHSMCPKYYAENAHNRQRVIQDTYATANHRTSPLGNRLGRRMLSTKPICTSSMTRRWPSGRNYFLIPRLDLRPDRSLHCLPLPEATGSSNRQIHLVGSEGRVGTDVANNGSARPARAEEMPSVQGDPGLVRRGTRVVDIKIEEIGACPEKPVRWENESPNCIVPCFRLDLAGLGAMVSQLAVVFRKQPPPGSFFT